MTWQKPDAPLTPEEMARAGKERAAFREAIKDCAYCKPPMPCDAHHEKLNARLKELGLRREPEPHPDELDIDVEAEAELIAEVPLK